MRWCTPTAAFDNPMKRSSTSSTRCSTRLKTTRQIGWRAPIASLNYLLSSHVWRQDHNGLSHQDPGFIYHVVNKKAEVVRVYLPPAPTPCCPSRTIACAAGTT